jgi:fluoroacetyl-CoA thioesterase
MKSRPRTGEVAVLEFTVTEQHIIDFADDVMPEVLSTPWLIWFLEHTARKAMLPHLDPEESTVGAMVNVEHLSPTPPGATVKCQAKIIYSDKYMFSFELRAWDGHDLVCRGTHKLRVIRKARLAQVVSKKAQES